MTTIALQQELIKKISTIQDEATLSRINKLINIEQSTIQFSNLQKNLISQAEKDYENGNYTEHAVLMDKLAKKHGW
ncbi:MAG: hypothetical protein ACOVLC_10805 [Flavobacterium sp.]